MYRLNNIQHVLTLSLRAFTSKGFVMSKPSWTAAEIQQYLQDEVNNTKARQRDGSNIVIPLPTLQASGEFGVNWEISEIENAGIYLADIVKMIDELRMRITLKA